jgi:5-methylcytosine-specific restriction endonuclease McrA
MSKRIEDSLDVLRLVRDSHIKDRTKRIDYLRSKAIALVAQRGVDGKTVFAHLVGKNVPSKLSSREFDLMLEEWLINNSATLKEWYLRHADRNDRIRIDNFFDQPQVLDTPKAIDLDEPLEIARIETTTYRILRDTVLSREVKIAHRFKCQLCGNTIPLRDGSFYAEAHHVKPLGKPYNGPDIKENIICVCPTCHVLLDYGVIALEKSQVPNISAEYVEYHNREIQAKG